MFTLIECSRIEGSLTLLQVPTAELKASSAMSCASSVAWAYWLPAFEVAAPKADSPDALALLAALFVSALS